jgi:hypothetical protein
LYRYMDVIKHITVGRLKWAGHLMMMSMGWDYVIELRPPTGLLFIHQVIYEHGEPWWNKMGRGKLLIRPPELSGNPTRRVIY